MDQLWPGAATGADVRALYDYPRDLDRPHVRVNFVASLDGAVSLDGRSRGLSEAADREVFQLQRALADVILVGAGTARDEGYRGYRPTAERAALRAEAGLAPVPPIAVITASCALTPADGLVADTVVPPIVLTVSSAPVANRHALLDAGVDVVVLDRPDDDRRVDLAAAVAALGDRGLRRVLCEGGAPVLGGLIEADLVDELCLTLSPRLVGGSTGRIARGGVEVERRLALTSVVHDDDNLLLRYIRR